MSGYQTVRVGNNPLLIIASAALAFGATHFYFNQPGAGELAAFIGNFMLIPLYFFSEFFRLIGMESLISKVAIIFAVLFFSYATVVLACSKILSLYAAREQNRQTENS